MAFPEGQTKISWTMIDVEWVMLRKNIAIVLYHTVDNVDCTRDFIQMKHEQYGLSNPNIMVSPYLRKEG